MTSMIRITYISFLEIISMKCPMQKREIEHRRVKKFASAAQLANAFLGLIAKTVAQLASSSTYCHTTLFDCQVVENPDLFKWCFSTDTSCAIFLAGLSQLLPVMVDLSGGHQRTVRWGSPISVMPRVVFGSGAIWTLVLLRMVFVVISQVSLKVKAAKKKMKS